MAEFLPFLHTFYFINRYTPCGGVEDAPLMGVAPVVVIGQGESLMKMVKKLLAIVQQDYRIHARC